MTDHPRPTAVSNHALDRFAQRFPGQDFDDAIARAVPLSLNVVARWAKTNGRPFRLNRENVVWWDGETGVAFVCKRVDSITLLVVTVFPIRKPKKVRGKATEQKRYPYHRDHGKIGYELGEDDRGH